MCGKSLIKPIVYQLNVEKLVKQWCSQDLEVGAQGVHGQSPWWGGGQGAKPPAKAHSILHIFCCQTMHSFVYLAELAKHEKNQVFLRPKRPPKNCVL